jgi:hypothetical protein
MANIKQVSIRGHMPFDIAYTSDSVAIWLGQINSPLSNLKITYSGDAYDTPKEHKAGRTSMHEFHIVGTSSMLFSVFHKLVGDFENNGVDFTSIEIIDIEDGHDKFLWYKEDIAEGNL